MNEALGMIEVYGVAHSILIADSMLKTANIRVISTEEVSQAYYTIVIAGYVDSVHLAIEHGREIAGKASVLIASKVIARQMKETITSLLKNNV
ncbi:BMC domain-containing protein [Sporosarcina sp. P29]|uniref:BMC domain-containing protein n=1 Tax=Sporosarcina sp. P29 TaxID=2048252 RepID=UPI000C17041E|nr:BMC domain-containing protein [Sporosarcina sp. P29]PIC99917.1 ethanolamine utilization protein EutM [Sporosarcina sp. P29]